MNISAPANLLLEMEEEDTVIRNASTQEEEKISAPTNLLELEEEDAVIRNASTQEEDKVPLQQISYGS